MPRRPHRRRSRYRPWKRRRSDLCPDDPSVRWMLRAILYGRRGGLHHVLDALAPEVATALGLRLPRDRKGGIQADAALTLLRARLAAIERKPARPSVATRNAALLGRLLDLDRVETSILALTIDLALGGPLDDCLRALDVQSVGALCTSLARVLGFRAAAVRRALSRHAPLRGIPVIHVGGELHEPLSLAPSVDGALTQPIESEAALLRHYVAPAPRARLGLGDYPHLAGECDLLVRYVRAALRRHKRGANVLLYGPPGTGKTELAQAIARAAGADLYAVNLEDDDHDAHEGTARLGAYALAQRMLGGRENTLLLFDEVEDAFPEWGALLGIGHASHPDRRKAWTNRLLEDNRIPAVWISNTLGGIDRAARRRFDLAIEVGQPPRSVRRRIVEKHLGRLDLPAGKLDALAEIEELSPAHVERAARVVGLLGREPGGAAGAARGRKHDASGDLDRVLRHNLRAYTGKRPKPSRLAPEVPYDLSLVNANVDVGALIAGVRASRRAALCLYGPPGTGKTEFAHYLARQLDRPLLARRASDLLSMWVGGTEHLIARMFEEAEREGAVLLLDEADSFLRDRRFARASWEVTQVNEMLTQMETFGGIFVCSTNLVDGLDRASLRRFGLKARFDYLSSEQAARLFEATLAALGGGAPEVERGPARADVVRLRVLTPGDFAAVARRFRMLAAPPTPADLARALAEECAMKQERGRAVGFGA